VKHGVTILGPTNLPAEIPNHASQMFSNNVTTFLLHLTEDGQLSLDLQDEIVQGTLAAHDGQVVNERLREILELPPLNPPAEEPAAEEPEDSEDEVVDSDQQGESS
jgi:NAD(P) transhydrogenase subunit alpha